MEIDSVIESIQKNLTPDLLKPEYRDENKDNPMFGHCYVASEALYHILIQFDENRWKPMYGKDDRGITHWWIKDTQTGAIHDVTADQYYSIGEVPPYDNGRGASFLTNKPSKRCKVLLKRIEEDKWHTRTFI